nr:TIM barrel protein [Liquorilactobacillus sicerae]
MQIKRPQLGLKGGTIPNQLNDRLQYKPEVFEFFTAENDFTQSGLKRLKEAIQLVQAVATSKIVLHHPMRYQGEFTELVAPQTVFPDLVKFIDKSTNDLLQLSFDLNVQTLVHGSYLRHTQKMIDLYPSLAIAREKVFQKLDYFAQLGQQHIMFENSISPIFYFGGQAEEQEIIDHHYRLAFDTSHCFIKLQGNNEQLIDSLQNLKSSIVHYHLVDSMGLKHDSLPLGQGRIDWRRILPTLNSKATNIYEINLKDNDNCQEQLLSHQYLLNIYHMEADN